MLAAPTSLVLLVDPCPVTAAQFLLATHAAGLDLKVVPTCAEAWAALEDRLPLAVVSEYWLRDSDGLSLLARIKERSPAVKRILHTAARPRQAHGQDIPVLAKPCDNDALRELLRAIAGFDEPRNAA